MFPDDQEKGHIVPVNKKDPKAMLINYRLISLLPRLPKIFENIIFTAMFGYFIKNELFSV